ncbi:Tripartite tricarboxylate transporter family receptor [compost metagenome]
MIDLVAGQVSALFAAFPTVFPQVRAGRLRAVAVTGMRRAAAAPELPTVAEVLAGFDSVQWWAMFAPSGTAAEVVDRLNGEVARIIADTEIKNRFAAEGAESVGGSPRDFASFLKADYDKWGKVVKGVGIRPE